MDPFLRLSQRQLLRTIFTLLALTLGAFLAIASTNAPLQNEVAPLGIVSLQFSGGLPEAAAILNSWGETERIYAAFNLGLDYLYLVGYSLLLSLICSLLARRAQGLAQRWLAGAGFSLAWAMLATAMLDMIENYALLQLLLGSTITHWPTLATVCAISKFTIIAAAILYVLLGAVNGLYKLMYRNVPKP